MITNSQSGQKKKILTIAPYTFLPATSGGQRAVYYLDQHLGKVADLICISTDHNHPAQLPEPITFTLKPLLGSGIKRYVNPGHYFKIRKLIKLQHIDAVIIEHPYLGWLGWLLQATTGVPFIIRSHNIEALRFKDLGKWWWRILADYERWGHRRARHSFFITKEDADYAVRAYKIAPQNATIITYGLEKTSNFTVEKKRAAVLDYKAANQISPDKTLLLFNGIFSYHPNDTALTLLLEKIYPLLLKEDAAFHLIVCGANIPEKYRHLKTPNLSVLGFVSDIQKYFQSAEIFLNPIWLGGGIKTKLVEALAAGSSAVSFQSGAIGIDPTLLAGKLKIVEDNDIAGFVNAIRAARDAVYTPTPTAFLDYFDWDKIAGKANLAIRNL